MSKKVLRNQKKIPNVIPWAGMRPDKRRKSTKAAQPNHESLLEEIRWRKEHIQ